MPTGARSPLSSRQHPQTKNRETDERSRTLPRHPQGAADQRSPVLPQRRRRFRHHGIQDVLDCDGRHGPLPSVTIGITDAGGIICLDECLDGIVGNIPDGDWCNNEGGYGHVTLYPQESDEDLRVECDMTYGEDDSDPDFEDEEFIASDFKDTDPQNSGDAIAVDDSTLQPAKGNIP